MKQPDVIIFVEGGLVQAVRSTVPLTVQVFDKDNYDAGGRAEREDMRRRFIILGDMDIDDWWSDVVRETHPHGAF